jgi:molecular chaperone DnaK
MESETLVDDEKNWWIPGRKVVVVDVGRSVEATLLELHDGREVSVLQVESGKPFVGGSALDKVILDKILMKFERENKMDLAQDPMSYTRVADAVQVAKHELSTKLTAEINLPYITADATGPKHLIETVKRSEFIRDVDPVVQGMLAPIKRLAKKSNDIIKEDDESIKPLVIMVGGCARSEHLRNEVTGCFGKDWETIVLEIPEEAVVTGAAVLAARGAGWK